MGRIYTVSFADVAVTQQQDLFEIVAAAGRTAIIRGLELSQSSEVGDAQEEGLSILFKSGQTTSGASGSAPTPVPVDVNDNAAGFSAEANNTTKASAGTIVTHRAAHWNVRAPYLWMMPPEMCIRVTGGRRFTVELATTPADSITLSGTLYVEEM